MKLNTNQDNYSHINKKTTTINITILQHYIHNNKCKIDLVMCELFHDTFFYFKSTYLKKSQNDFP